MADNVFGNPNLFAEFDREPCRSDEILLTKIKGDNLDCSVTNGSPNDGDGSKEKTRLNCEDADSRDSDVDGFTFGDGGKSQEGIPASSDKECSDKNNVQLLEKIKKLQSELKTVRAESERLKRTNRLINPSKYFKDEEGPAFQVLFMNKMVASKQRHTVEEFLCGLMMQYQATNYKEQPEERVRAASVCLDDVSEVTPTPEEKMRRMSASTVIGSCQMYPGFIVDSTGWGLHDNKPMLSDSWIIPAYLQVFLVPLPADDSEEDDPPKKKANRSSCWNCGEGHSLKDCQQPRDARKIQENRKAFQSQAASFQMKQGRYHKEGDDQNSRASYRPGHIGEELRKALELEDDQLPPYVYQMRVLGYPPGYLQKLKDHASGLTMYDSHGKETKLDGEPGEDGELDVSVTSDIVDVKKIIEYPGFNVPAGEDIVDESDKLGIPKLNPSHSVEMMAQFLSPDRGVKRSHNQRDHSSSKRKKDGHSQNAEDMDLSQTDRPVKQKKGEDEETSSLDQLEEQRQLLQRQLALEEGEDADCQVVDSIADESLDNDSPSIFDAPKPESPDVRRVKETETPQSPPAEPSAGSSPSRSPSQDPPQQRFSFDGDSSTPAKTPASSQFRTPEQSRHLRTPSTGCSLNITFGTPVVDDGVKLANKGLPEPNRFAEGITQHIPFENLPGATGTYDRLKTLLDHIKTRKKSSES